MKKALKTAHLLLGDGKTFRKWQKQCIVRGLRGDDGLISKPTGNGKSAGFQGTLVTADILYNGAPGARKPVSGTVVFFVFIKVSFTRTQEDDHDRHQSIS